MKVGAVWPFAWPDMRFSVQVHGATQCLSHTRWPAAGLVGLWQRFRLNDAAAAAAAATVLLAGACAVHRRLVAHHWWSAVHAAESPV